MFIEKGRAVHAGPLHSVTGNRQILWYELDGQPVPSDRLADRLPLAEFTLSEDSKRLRCRFDAERLTAADVNRLVLTELLEAGNGHRQRAAGRRARSGLPGKIKDNLTMESRPYTPAEEMANSLTHGLGSLLSLAALALLAASPPGTGIPGSSPAARFTASPSCCSTRPPPSITASPPREAKRILKIVDHSSIFLLIAGTYTPFLLITLRGPWGWTLFGAGLGHRRWRAS